METAVAKSTEPLLFAFMQVAEGRLRKHALEVPLAIGNVWPESDTPRYAHFLRSGAVSRVMCLSDGRCASVRLSTRGELLEALPAAGVMAYADQMSVILPGRALRVPLDLVRDAFVGDSRFRLALMSQIGIHASQAAQASVCNIYHHVEARLARYLAQLTESWAGPLPITHETIADELGVRRSSVTLTMGDLRRRGFLELRRGKIEVIDKARLVRLACECYKPAQQVVEDRGFGLHTGMGGKTRAVDTSHLANPA